MTQRTLGLLILWAVVTGCGPENESAGLDQDDPLHAGPIRLPPPAVWRPLPERTPAEEIKAPPPPFSEGIFPCSRCHAGGSAAADTAPTLSHGVHLERDIECGDCHMPDDEPAPTIPSSSVCFDCHEDLPAEPERVRAYFARVGDGEGGYRFPKRWETGDVAARHAKHAAAKVGCEECHGQPGTAPFSKPKSVALMARCIACHEERKGPAADRCESCHETIREPQHKHIVLHHAEEQRGCLDCHDPEDRDTLRLANGEKVPFARSYVLCGQCHGPKLRDWKAGLHGKRTGMWDGPKQYLLCVHCHRDPHAPRFPMMVPDPPPLRPGEIR